MTTPSVTGTPQAFAFSTAGSGTLLTYTGGGTANSSTWDVLLINSDTTVSTPSGWTPEDSSVGGQGAYVFTKNGGTSSVTVTTAGNFAAEGLWVRVTDSGGVDTGATSKAVANGSAALTTPSLTTPALASATSLALAWAALHSFGAAPVSYTWSSGYTELVNGSNLTSGSVAGSVAVKVPAGTPAETPNATWPANAPSDRYIFFLAFSPSAGGGGAVAPTGLAVAVALGQPTVANGMDAVAPNGISVPVALGQPTVSQGGSVAPNGLAVSVALGQATVTWSRTSAPTGLAVAVALGAPTVAMSGGAVAPTGLAVAVALGQPVVAGQPYSPPVNTGAGGWFGLLGIIKAAREDLAAQRDTGWISCPNDGEPLSTSESGEVYCRYDGWRPGQPVRH